MIRRKGLQVQVDESIPAELASAQSQYDLAMNEFKRNQQLVAQNAGSGKNLNKAKTEVDAAKAALDGLNAKLLQAKAEVKSAEAAIEQALQTQKDAERDLANTELYSAFPGVVAETHVVPGSLSGPNSSVVTVQMMNPIKVDLEVSAEKSRQMNQGDTLKLTIPTSDNSNEIVEASVYTIAPSADNATRTFTLTLLVVNKKVQTPVKDETSTETIALTPSLWKVGLKMLPKVSKGTYYMPETALRKDDVGDYVWRIDNLDVSSNKDRTFNVEKFYLKLGDVRVPFLGRAYFQTVQVLPDQKFNPDSDFFATEVLVNGEPASNWEGDTMQLGTGQRWLLRPGDLVQVDLSGNSNLTGIYVPVEAINEDSGRTYVYAVEDSTVQKIEVRSSNAVGQSQHRIEPVDENVDLGGKTIVVEGVHYLLDGQEVSVVGTWGEAA